MIAKYIIGTCYHFGKVCDKTVAHMGINELFSLTSIRLSEGYCNVQKTKRHNPRYSDSTYLTGRSFPYAVLVYTKLSFGSLPQTF